MVGTPGWTEAELKAMDLVAPGRKTPARPARRRATRVTTTNPETTATGAEPAAADIAGQPGASVSTAPGGPADGYERGDVRVPGPHVASSCCSASRLLPSAVRRAHSASRSARRLTSQRAV